jgi:septal ring factor EnvC (AmiA/AmiB activator)
MEEVNLLEGMLSSNPNLPAQKGELLILHTEMRSEFRSFRLAIGDFSNAMDRRFEKMADRMDKLNTSTDLIAQTLAGQIQRTNQIEKRLSNVERDLRTLVVRTCKIEKRMDAMDQRTDGLEQGMKTLLERTQHLGGANQA